MKKIILSIIAICFAASVSFGQEGTFSLDDLMRWVRGEGPPETTQTTGTPSGDLKLISPSSWQGTDHVLNIDKSGAFTMKYDDRTDTGVFKEADGVLKMYPASLQSKEGACKSMVLQSRKKNEMILKDCKSGQITYIRRRALLARNFANTTWIAQGNTTKVLRFTSETEYTMHMETGVMAGIYSISGRKLMLNNVEYKVVGYHDQVLELERDGVIEVFSKEVEGQH